MSWRERHNSLSISNRSWIVLIIIHGTKTVPFPYQLNWMADTKLIQSWYQFGTNTTWLHIPIWFRQNQKWFYSCIPVPKRFSSGIEPIPFLVASDNPHLHQIGSVVSVCRYQTHIVCIVMLVSVWCKYDITMFAGLTTNII